jgi:hypothetical protein
MMVSSPIQLQFVAKVDRCYLLVSRNLPAFALGDPTNSLWGLGLVIGLASQELECIVNLRQLVARFEVCLG